jgi:hypothetical protein
VIIEPDAATSATDARARQRAGTPRLVPGSVEPLSPELALVDPDLAEGARALLPDHRQPDDRIGPIEPAALDEPISQELALVDPGLAERAGEQLPDIREPAPCAPVRQPKPDLECPSLMPVRADRAVPIERTRRRRTRASLIVAMAALAAGLGAAAALWARLDDSTSSSREVAQPTATGRPQRSSPVTRAVLDAATTARTPRRGVAGARYAMNRKRSRRPPAFHVPGAPKEPLDEISLPDRAYGLSAWLTPSRRPTAANVRHWLYQHAWIVTGARLGWWHGAAALRVLIRVDRRIESMWGIGYRSEAGARNALAALEARTR